MAAPFSRSISRRTFLGGAAAVVVLAACGGDDASSSVDTDVASQIATPDNPVTFPLYEDNPVIADGLQPESGTHRIANYADFVSPELVDAFKQQYGVDVEISTYENGPELLSRITSGALQPDLILSVAIDQLPKYVGGKLIQPLNKTYLSNTGNLWPSAANPFFDQGLRYSVPYTVFTTGLGYRTDVIESTVVEQQGWDTLWDPAYAGQAGLLNDSREAFAMAMLKLGLTNINTPSDDDLAAATEELQRLVDESRVKIDVVAYEKLPAGTASVNQAWSGDLVLATSYLPEGTDASVLGYWKPSPDVTVVGTDTSAILKDAEHPVLAHLFLDMLMDTDNALTNFAFTGYQGVITGLEAENVLAAGILPDNLTNTLVGDTDFAEGIFILALPRETEAKLEDAWSRVNAGG
jgi:spermidine/putrescine transport system substrate-binding protein